MLHSILYRPICIVFVARVSVYNSLYSYYFIALLAPKHKGKRITLHAEVNKAMNNGCVPNKIALLLEPAPHCISKKIREIVVVVIIRATWCIEIESAITSALNGLDD